MKVTQNHLVMTPTDKIIFQDAVGDLHNMYYDVTLGKIIVEGELDADKLIGVQKLSDVADVLITNHQPGDILKWNGTKWVNVDPATVSFIDNRITINNGTIPASPHAFDMHVIIEG
jgi:hypothetical protein